MTRAWCRHMCEPSHQHQRERKMWKWIFLLCTRKICHFFFTHPYEKILRGLFRTETFFRQMLQLTSRWIEWQKWSLSPWRKRKIVRETWCNRRWSQLKFSENCCRNVPGRLFSSENFNVASQKKSFSYATKFYSKSRCVFSALASDFN